ncbi:high-affinity iron transporter [Crenobacter luteus]|uniref:FTR1 family iron permease n=1 Tax=Crenobacter luteus TaxID=1452487 RepID=UPI001048BE33|nr:FTR1 family protein [Crenobacter luteus]TCP11576.1 high-affinity iron transporter [Crenobacter luteus]
MGQILFVVWRESVEAMLVIGILYSWLRHNPAGRSGLPWLWGGVGLGVALAGALGAGILFFDESLSSEGQDYFKLAMTTAASALIVQMVIWMRRHGRTLKKDMESGLAARSAAGRWWGVTTLTALAVAREGSETVVFLYGMGLGQQGLTLASFAAVAVSGVALAVATYWLLQKGGRMISWRFFFRLTEGLLLLLAASLLMNSVEQLISLDLVPALVDPLWDSSALIDDSSTMGSLFATFTGYRSHPALTMLLAYVGYWLAVYKLTRPSAAPAERVAA